MVKYKTSKAWFKRAVQKHGEVHFETVEVHRLTMPNVDGSSIDAYGESAADAQRIMGIRVYHAA